MLTLISKKRSTSPDSKNARYGWTADRPDHRDFVAVMRQGTALPTKVDLTGYCPPVVDQGALGSCTANAIAAAFDVARCKKAGGVASAYITPSRLFIYYNERVMEGTVNSDSGAMIRDGIKSIAKQGVCPETNWPYVIKKFKTRPSAAAFTAALEYQAVSYARVPRTMQGMRVCLAGGLPFVFGFTVYADFESSRVAKTGEVNLPAAAEENLGGHAVLCVGYDDATQRFLVRNSWGKTWGKHGYFTLPYAYLLDENLSDDFWVVSSTE